MRFVINKATRRAPKLPTRNDVINVYFTKYIDKDSAGLKMSAMGYVNRGWDINGKLIEVIDWAWICELEGDCYREIDYMLKTERRQMSRTIVRYLLKNNIIKYL